MGIAGSLSLGIGAPYSTALLSSGFSSIKYALLTKEEHINRSGLLVSTALGLLASKVTTFSAEKLMQESGSLFRSSILAGTTSLSVKSIIEHLFFNKNLEETFYRDLVKYALSGALISRMSVLGVEDSVSEALLAGAISAAVHASLESLREMIAPPRIKFRARLIESIADGFTTGLLTSSTLNLERKTIS